MSTLKGQSVRICTFDTTAEKYRVIGMSTGCIVTITNNMDNQSHKDITGLAAMPQVVSKTWQVQVNSLNQADAAAILTAMKSMQPVTLMWDETSTTDNQTRSKASWARKGQAYLNDATFSFDNKTLATKGLQFTGTGPLEAVAASEATEVIPLGSYTRGETVRLFLSSDNTAAPTAVIASARTLQLHVSISLQDASTKDSTGDWIYNEPTELNYDITTSALVRSGEPITSLVTGKTYADILSMTEAGTAFKWKIANVGGDNNRTASSTIVSGSIKIATLTQNDPNRENSEYTMNANGYGDYTVAA